MWEPRRALLPRARHSPLTPLWADSVSRTTEEDEWGVRSDVRAAPEGDAALIPEQPRQGSRRPAPGSRATPEPDQVDTSRTLPVKAGSVPAGTRPRAGASPPHHARTHDLLSWPLLAPGLPACPSPSSIVTGSPDGFPHSWPPLPVPPAPRLSSNYLLGNIFRSGNTRRKEKGTSALISNMISKATALSITGSEEQSLNIL